MFEYIQTLHAKRTGDSGTQNLIRFLVLSVAWKVWA